MSSPLSMISSTLTSIASLSLGSPTRVSNVSPLHKAIEKKESVAREKTRKSEERAAKKAARERETRIKSAMTTLRRAIRAREATEKKCERKRVALEKLRTRELKSQERVDKLTFQMESLQVKLDAAKSATEKLSEKVTLTEEEIEEFDRLIAEHSGVIERKGFGVDEEYIEFTAAELRQQEEKRRAAAARRANANA